MSDVGIAPAPAPSAPPVSQSEVPINPSPVNAPSPIGSQAPSKAPDDMKSADHRRDSIKQAFDRAKSRDPNDKGEPRRARMGDNNPPEETKPEREKPEKIDLRKPPGEQPRDRGRFAAREPEGTPQVRGRSAEGAPQVRGRSAEGAPQVNQLPERAPYREPLERMSERAKQEWHAAPESVRADMHRMSEEFSRAYQHYRADHEEMNSIRDYSNMAREHGTTLHKALTNYVSMEHKLRSDVIGGLDIIVNNLNLRTPDGTKIVLEDIAHHILNQSPEQRKLVQNQNAQSAQSQQIGQLHQMVNTLAQGYQQMQYERQFGQTRSAIDQYADSHPRFDELGDLIEKEIKLGFGLDEAYRRAELLRPATHAAQTRTNSTAAQTRTSDRSIRGAPEAGSFNGSQRRAGKPPPGRREAIANAMKRANGSL